MKEKYIEDIREIKDIMNRTSRFISLSGWSGVSTGIIALAGVYVACEMIFKDGHYLTTDSVVMNGEKRWLLLGIALGTLILSTIAAVFFTAQNTRRKEQRTAWDPATRRLLIHLFLPLLTGGIVCLIFLFRGFIGVLPGFTLVFYGLALINGSKYTFPEIRHLGSIEIVLGLLALAFVPYGLWFWALGFGIVQMVYGIAVQYKYRS